MSANRESNMSHSPFFSMIHTINDPILVEVPTSLTRLSWHEEALHFPRYGRYLVVAGFHGSANISQI